MSYTGMSRETGKQISGLEHLRQSITDILTTPLGSRVQRPTYGSKLYELVDAPLNPATKLEIIVATVQALADWEPRLRVTKTTVTAGEPGAIAIALEGIYLPTGEPVRLEGIIVE